MDTAAASFEALKQLHTLDQFIPNRVKLAPHAEALRQFDRRTNSWEHVSYQDLNERIHQWRCAFAAMNLDRGTRIGILLPNGIDHVCCDQAALANGLVCVPLHAIDTAGSSAFILADSQAQILVTNFKNRWDAITASAESLPDIKAVIFTEDLPTQGLEQGPRQWDLESWLANGHDVEQLPNAGQEDDIVTIVYTSGTTGRPKGVMLTHRNVVSNVKNTLQTVLPEPGEIFLSFLPLSHTYERMAGYYLALGMGCTIVYNRSIPQLAEDFRLIKPHAMISVPRIYERIYAKVQARLAQAPSYKRSLFYWAVSCGWRNYCRRYGIAFEQSFASKFDWLFWPMLSALVAKPVLNQFGGRLRYAISGGAALQGAVAQTFCGLGVPIIQGYGMTESSPIIAGNSLSYNHPNTVGKPLPNTRVRLDKQTQEIQVKSDSIMKGYWHREEATREVFTEDGWFRTGDVGEFDADGFLRIVGRIKEIIVTSTGEKVPPSDLEQAIELDELFDQALVIGENRPCISTIVVLNPKVWNAFAKTLGVDPQDPESLHVGAVQSAVLKRIKMAVQNFPKYAQPRNVLLTLEPWTIENELITPTLKLKRKNLHNKFAAQIQAMYAGHR